jgi:DnaJ-class molecular chaperone
VSYHEEECGFCDGTGEECESRGIPQKCGACNGSGVLSKHARLIRRHEGTEEALLRRCDNPWVEEC